jgi:hypothetical protein
MAKNFSKTKTVKITKLRKNIGGDNISLPRPTFQGQKPIAEEPKSLSEKAAAFLFGSKEAPVQIPITKPIAEEPKSLSEKTSAFLFGSKEAPVQIPITKPIAEEPKSLSEKASAFLFGSKEAPVQEQGPVQMQVPVQTQIEASKSKSFIERASNDFFGPKEELSPNIPERGVSKSKSFSEKTSSLLFESNKEHGNENKVVPVNNNMTRIVIIAVLITLFLLIILAVGLFIMFRKPKYDSKIDANVLTAHCDNNPSICYIDIAYAVDGKEYIQKDVSVTSLRTLGTKESILYNSSDPSQFEIAPPVWVRWGIGGSLTGISIGCIIGIWVWYSIKKRKNTQI